MANEDWPCTNSLYTCFYDETYTFMFMFFSTIFTLEAISDFPFLSLEDEAISKCNVEAKICSLIFTTEKPLKQCFLARNFYHLNVLDFHYKGSLMDLKGTDVGILLSMYWRKLENLHKLLPLDKHPLLFMVPKVFEPLKFCCMYILLARNLFTIYVNQNSKVYNKIFIRGKL